MKKQDFIKVTAFCIFFLGRSFHALGTDFDEHFALDQLTQNVYSIQHVMTQYPLVYKIMEYNEANESEIYEATKSKINYGFRFIENDKGFFIREIINDQYLFQATDGKISYCKEKEPEKEPWNIILMKKNGFHSSWIIKIQNINSGKYLTIIPKTDNKTIYDLVLREGGNLENEWFINPFYPNAGYSNFFDIIADFSELIYLKHSQKVNRINTLPSIGFEGLSVKNMEDKTWVILEENSRSCKKSVREIFGSEEYFISDDSNSEIRSKFNFTRVIETEEIFQATIENSLATTNRKSKSQENKMSQVSDRIISTGMEKIDQISFDEKLSTLININISKHLEKTDEDTQTRSTSTEKGTSHSKHEGSQSSHNASLQAKGNVPFLGKCGVSYGYSNTSNQGTNTGTHENSSDTRQNSSIQISTRGDNIQHGGQEGTEKSKQTGASHKGMETYQTTKGAGKETNYMENIDLEQTLSLNEVTSVTKKKNEKWFIDRELYQKPNTTLHIRCFEECIEAVNVPFYSSITLSGRIGFVFDKLIRHMTLRCPQDYFDWHKKMWCITPATITYYLPAPGYHLNLEDGSLNYIIRGKINLKHPINILTVINGVEKKEKQEIKEENIDMRVETPFEELDIGSTGDIPQVFSPAEQKVKHQNAPKKRKMEIK